MNNLKIQVTKDQPLEDIVRELDKIGYKKDDTLHDIPGYVYAFADGYYCVYMGDHGDDNLTTLAELKEMKSERN